MKSFDTSNDPTQEILDKLEELNFAKPHEQRSTHMYQQSMLRPNESKSLHKINHPTIAMYHHSRLLYNLINDNSAFREEATLVGEEELKHFICSRDNLNFFLRSGDVHLHLAACFLIKSMSWLNLFKEEDQDFLNELEIIDIE